MSIKDIEYTYRSKQEKRSKIMKKLFIVGKRYTEEYIRKCIDTHPDIFTDAYYFDYSQYITHSKDWVLR